MIERRVILTKHAVRRHRERVGHLPYKFLIARLNTAYACGLYREADGLIKIRGIWWGCESKDDGLILTTCLGRRDRVPATERREANAD